MANSLLSSLMGITLADNPTKGGKVEKETTTRKRVEKNPTNGADIRIMSSGKVYPSNDFTSKWGLEYTNENGNTISNGIDLFRAQDWTNYTQGGNTRPLLLGYVIPQTKKNPKIELFAGTRYDADGNPINSVLEQGSILSDETLELIATGLGYNTTPIENPDTEHNADVNTTVSAWRTMLGDKRYIDLKFEETGDTLKTSDGKYFIPKAINKGEKKGEVVTVKRQGINLMLVTEFTPNTMESMEDQTSDGSNELPTYDSSIADGIYTTGDIEVGNTGDVPQFEDLLAVHKQFETQDAE